MSSCSICKSAKRADIEAASSQGQQSLAVAQTFRVSVRALEKHMRQHVGLAPEASPSPPSAPAGTQPAPPVPASAESSNVIAFPGGRRPEADPVPAPAPICSVCVHEKRGDIEAAIAKGDVFSAIARRFFLVAEDVKKHSAVCTKGELRRQASKVAGDARAECAALVERVKARVQQAEDDGEDAKAWAAVAAQLRGAVELLGKFNRELGPDVEINIVQSPRWKKIEAAIAAALVPFPEAGKAVAKALEQVEVAA